MKKKILFLGILVVLIFFGYTMTQKNLGERVEEGDVVEIDYVGLFENGEIFDTTMKNHTYLHKKSPYFREKQIYKPLIVVIGKGEFLEFEKVLIGMRIGEEREIQVPPKTEFDESLVIEVSKIQKMPKIFEWSESSFKDIAGTSPKVGLTFSAGGFSFKVLEIKEDMIVLEKLIEEGEIVLTPYGHGEVREIQEKEFTVWLISEVGDSVSHRFGNEVKVGIVIDEDNEKIVIDFNPPLAGKTLLYKIYLRKKLENYNERENLNVPPNNYVEYSNIKWIWNDIEYALEIAREEKKLVLLDFWTPWCSWCVKMDREVYPDYSVEKIMENFIAVKIDHDRFPELSKKYNITGHPTIIILDSEGNELGRIVGYRPAYELVAILEEYVKRFFILK